MSDQPCGAITPIVPRHGTDEFHVCTMNEHEGQHRCVCGYAWKPPATTDVGRTPPATKVEERSRIKSELDHWHSTSNRQKPHSKR